jgi:hypothetical protein
LCADQYLSLRSGSPVRLQADETEQEERQDSKSVRRPKEKVAQELSDILYLKSVHFDSFQQFKSTRCSLRFDA